MAKRLSTPPPSSSVAKLLEPGIGAAAIRPVNPASGAPAGAPEGRPAAPPPAATGEPADVKRELTLTRSTDETLQELVAIYQRATGCRLHASHLMRSMLRALQQLLPEIERAAESLGPLRRPSNATGREAERDAFECRLAASLLAALRGDAGIPGQEARAFARAQEGVLGNDG
jgi:hypothetical protein